MGMKQYQDKFKHEQVDGEILAECDEAVLTNDLGVTSKLHRMRLLKIISGMYMFSVLTLQFSIVSLIMHVVLPLYLIILDVINGPIYNYTTF